jgi:hypothetical protein
MSFFKALKTVRTKMGFENQELEELKTCIRKVPILAQCLTTEGARVNSRPVATSSAYARVDDDCSREELHGVIKTLRETQDPPTDELFRCYSSMLNTAKIANLYTQIQTAEKKEFYTNICSILQELWMDEQHVITLLNKVSEAQNGLGYDHPETLKSLSNLAGFYVEKGEYKRALPVYEDCLAKRQRGDRVNVDGAIELTTNPLNKEIIAYYLERVNYCKDKIEEQEQKDRLGGRSKSKRNHKNKNKYFRSTRRRRYSRARGGKKFATSSSKTIKRRRKNVR